MPKRRHKKRKSNRDLEVYGIITVMEQRTFWEQTFPRIAAIVIAILAFAYLLYDLLVRGNELSGLHLGILLIVLALVLATIASRLKIVNFLDFNSKLESLREETTHELRGLRNQISTAIDLRIRPEQHQMTIFNMGGSLAKPVLEQLVKQYQASTIPAAGVDNKRTEYSREQFLRRADTYRARAYTILVLARAFQTSILEHRTPEPDDTGNGSIDERIVYLVEKLIDDGLQIIIPFHIEKDTKENIQPQILEETTVNLRLLNSLLDLRNKVDNEEIPLPSRDEVDELIDKVADALSTVQVAIAYRGTLAIMYEYEMMSKIKELRAKYLGSDAENGSS